MLDPFSIETVNGTRSTILYLSTGTYTISESETPGWITTSGNPQQITVSGLEDLTVTFQNTAVPPLTIEKYAFGWITTSGNPQQITVSGLEGPTVTFQNAAVPSLTIEKYTF